MEEQVQEPGPSLSVVAKVRRILDVLAQEERPVGLSELSRRTAVPKSSVHRLCAELVGWGVIERAGNELQLGPALFELGQRAPVRRTLRDAAMPFMEDLFVATRETIHLAVPDGREACYVERFAGRRSEGTPSRVGGRVPLHCTATGKCMLAFGSPDVLHTVLSNAPHRRTPYTVVAPPMILACIAEVRNDGYAVEREEHHLGYASVAAPIFGSDAVLVAAVSITTPVSKMDVERFAPSLRAAALGVSRQLGASGPP